MKIRNHSASVVVLVDAPSFLPDETREVSDVIGAQLLTRPEFEAVEPKKVEAHKPESKKS